MDAPAPPAPDRAVEERTRRKYSGGFYSADTIMRHSDPEDADYFGHVDGIKRALVREYGARRRTLDLCCATAEHLLEDPTSRPLSIGVDFSIPFLSHAQQRAAVREAPATHFICGNARRLPFADGAFEFAYSFSSLYHIVRPDEALRELGRILSPSGVAAFDLGNLHSLNTLVCRASPETAEGRHVSVSAMRRMIADAGLRVERHLAFQILPMWGDRPRWLRPLLGRRACNLMNRRLGGRTLDEWIAGLPLVRRFAFRHLFVCRKETA